MDPFNIAGALRQSAKTATEIARAAQRPDWYEHHCLSEVGMKIKKPWIPEPENLEWMGYKMDGNGVRLAKVVLGILGKSNFVVFEGEGGCSLQIEMHLKGLTNNLLEIPFINAVFYS